MHSDFGRMNVINGAPCKMPISMTWKVCGEDPLNLGQTVTTSAVNLI